MTHSNTNAAREIKDMENKGEWKVAKLRTREGVLLDRKCRRRLDLKTIHGTMRESARVYREFCEGKINEYEFELRSRGLARHKDIVALAEQRSQITELVQQLKQLQHAGVGQLSHSSFLEPVALESADLPDADPQAPSGQCSEDDPTA